MYVTDIRRNKMIEKHTNNSKKYNNGWGREKENRWHINVICDWDGGERRESYFEWEWETPAREPAGREGEQNTQFTSNQ